MKCVIKKNVRTNFTIVDNRLFQESSLSYPAKGLYCSMLSKSDDWHFTLKNLAKEGNCGLDAVRSYLKQLIDFGLVRLELFKNEKGQQCSIYYVYDFDTMLENRGGNSSCPGSENPTRFLGNRIGKSHPETGSENPTLYKDIDINKYNIYMSSYDSTPKKNETPLPSSTVTEKTSKKGTRISENWQLDDNCYQYALSKGLDSLEIERQSELFLNYWLSKSGAAAVKKDWTRTWYTWVLNYVDRYQKSKKVTRYGKENQMINAFEHNKRLLEELWASEGSQDNNNITNFLTF